MLELSTNLLNGRRVARFVGVTQRWWEMPESAVTDADVLHHIGDVLDNYAEGNLSNFTSAFTELLDDVGKSE